MSEMNDLVASIFPGMPGAVEALDLQDAPCGCYDCLSEIFESRPFPQNQVPFIVCPLCGNKRCPKATNHANECTDSNDVCQAGSRYGGLDD